ncbi:MAG: FAD:protein FMN transferase [Candidatus Saccharicenans sp.]|uniref:FAD:protein FMN transferase n=1 Tax=Candidatus Saccharicenans sp. TaxID=2819258 RepID=UPI0040490C56
MPAKPVFRFSHEAMATVFEVIIASQEENYSSSAAAAFFKEIDRLESFFNRFDPRSEISRINRLKPGQVLPIGFETFECLKLSFELMLQTGGAFNVNFRTLRSNQGKRSRKSSGRISSRPFSGTGLETCRLLFPLELVEQAGGYAAVRLDLPGTSLDLDLGAIGKGYALEKAARVFADWDISQFLVSAGGSTVYARGRKSWPVAAGGGFDFFQSGKIALKNRALSASGHEVKGEHIYDARYQSPSSRQLAVWVSHPSPALADGLSTAFMVMSLPEIAEYCRQNPGVWTLVLGRDKKCYRYNFPDIREETGRKG